MPLGTLGCVATLGESSWRDRGFSCTVGQVTNWGLSSPGAAFLSAAWSSWVQRCCIWWQCVLHTPSQLHKSHTGQGRSTELSLSNSAGLRDDRKFRKNSLLAALLIKFLPLHSLMLLKKPLNFRKHSHAVALALRAHRQG